MEKRKCTITIIDVQAEDNGMWTCHLKNDIRSTTFSEAFVGVEVASPYSLSVEIPNELTFTQSEDTSMLEDDEQKNNEMNPEDKSILINAKDNHASCSATSLDNHGGGVEPDLTWFVNGIELKNVTSEIEQKLVSFPAIVEISITTKFYFNKQLISKLFQRIFFII